MTKHALATRVQIDLSLAGGVLSLEISDNGPRPFERRPREGALVRHPRGLHERAGTVGGWVDLSSGGGGTTLILSVPLSDKRVPAFAISKSPRRGRPERMGRPVMTTEPRTTFWP